MLRPLLSTAGLLVLLGACDQERTQTYTNLPPRAVIAGGNRTAAAGAAVVFDGRDSNDPEGALSSLAWDFGDGGSSAEALATHTWQTSGPFQVVLTVTDEQGATGSASVTVTVSAPPTNQPPHPVLVGPAQVDLGVPADFDATGSTDPDGTVQSYAWTFGDGATATGSTARHAWAAAGPFTVAVVVTDDDGATANAALAITVVDNRPPDYSGTYTVVANPKTGRCLSDGDATWVDTQLEITHTGASISAKEFTQSSATPLVQYAGSIYGASFTMVGQYTTRDSLGLTYLHDNTYTGTFQSPTLFTGTLAEHLTAAGGFVDCTVTWNVTGAR